MTIEVTNIEVNSNESIATRMSYLSKEIFGNTDYGKELLDLLVKHYLQTQVCDMNSPNWGYFREGQNNLVRYFLECSNNTEEVQQEINYNDG